MGLFALSLILAAAVLHATWNLLVKRANAGDLFAWLYGAAAAILYLPVSVPLLVSAWSTYTPRAWAAFIVSGLLNGLYFIVLQRAYRAGDLSVIYPLARGTGPVLSTLMAIWLLHERPSILALIGALLVVTSVMLFATSGGGGAERSARPTRAALAFGVATGAIIATYTIWDKQAVAAYGVSPALLPWATSVALTLALAPAAARQWGDVRAMWRRHWRAAIGVGVLYPLAYMLVLVAMRVSPVSYVAPAREVSILFGAAMGVRVLGEGHGTRRLIAASVMLLGLAALAWG
jgi:drug/metabolite transporter (DMT)-like permease